MACSSLVTAESELLVRDGGAARLSLEASEPTAMAEFSWAMLGVRLWQTQLKGGLEVDGKGSLALRRLAGHTLELLLQSSLLQRA